MEIEEAISLALTSVDKADLPEQLRERAFGEVLRWLLGGISSSAAGTVTREPAVGAGSASPEPGPERLAVRLGIPETALADVFAIEGDSVRLHVASAKISSTKSKATRDVALLIAVARQGAGIDESWTEAAHVRDALTHYNRYDISNFSKYLRDTGDLFNFRGKPVQLRLTRPGWEAATELVKTLTGSE